jgi:hypothetical protein
MLKKTHIINGLLIAPLTFTPQHLIKLMISVEGLQRVTVWARY